MATVIILNTIGLVILFAVCTVLSLMLMNAYKHIHKIEGEKKQAQDCAEHHKKELVRRAGEDENSNGYSFEERK